MTNENEAPPLVRDWYLVQYRMNGGPWTACAYIASLGGAFAFVEHLRGQDEVGASFRVAPKGEAKEAPR